MGMDPEQFWSDTHSQSKEIKNTLLAWRRQIEEFQCPLCHAGIGREFYSSAYPPMFQCPACGFPVGCLMLASYRKHMMETRRTASISKQKNICRLALAAIALGLAAGRCQAAPVRKTNAASELATVEKWVMGLQFGDKSQPSYGGVKVHHTISAISTDGKRYYRVSPYFSDLGVLAVLRARTPGGLPFAGRWIEWYLAHLSSASAPDGVPFEHFYLPDGGGETTCVKPGDHFLCHYNDATDSAAATFFSVLWAYREAGGSTNVLKMPGRKAQVERLASVLLALQQSDGLCWAKADYRVKYLEDNSEVYAGLRDLARLEESTYGDRTRAQAYAQAAARVRQGIRTELYDPKVKAYFPAKFEDGKRPAANLNKWYPDTQAQFWPVLWDVASPDDPRSRAALAALDARWNGQTGPDWTRHPEQVNSGVLPIDVAYAALLCGDTPRVRAFVQSMKPLKFPQAPEDAGFSWPFSIADAGWLLSILGH